VANVVVSCGDSSGRDCNRKADLLGSRLYAGAREIAILFTEELEKRDIQFRDEESIERCLIEIFVFYLHMIDRSAHVHLGLTKRELFADRLIVAFMKEIMGGLDKSVSADTFGETIRETYNRRQIEYASYKRLTPEKDEPLKGTLFLEFSKIIFRFLDDDNPATIFLLCMLIERYTVIFMTDAAKVEEVLTS